MVISGLIKSVEIYSTKMAFDKKLIQLSEGQITTVPKTYVGVADKYFSINGLTSFQLSPLLTRGESAQILDMTGPADFLK